MKMVQRNSWHIPALVAVTCALIGVGFFFVHAASTISKWDVIFSEMELALPMSAQTVLDVGARLNNGSIMVWTAATFPAIAVLVLFVALKRRKAGRLLGLGIAVLGVTVVACCVFPGSAMTASERLCIKELELANSPDIQEAETLARTLGDPQSPREQRLKAFRTLRFLGAKYRAGLGAQPMAAVPGLIETATSDTQNGEFRLLSAWSLMTIDRESREALKAVSVACDASVPDQLSDVQIDMKNFLTRPVVRDILKRNQPQ